MTFNIFLTPFRPLQKAWLGYFAVLLHIWNMLITFKEPGCVKGSLYCMCRTWATESLVTIAAPGQLKIQVSPRREKFLRVNSRWAVWLELCFLLTAFLQNRPRLPAGRCSWWYSKPLSSLLEMGLCQLEQGGFSNITFPSQAKKRKSSQKAVFRIFYSPGEMLF